MLGWFQKLMPREDNFFEMYTRHVATVTAGATELCALLKNEGDFAAHAAEISRQEDLADNIMRELLLAVRRTFITPFDRSDIAGLGTAIDERPGVELAGLQLAHGAGLLRVRYRSGCYLPDGSAMLTLAYVPDLQRLLIVTAGGTTFYLDNER